MSGDVIRGSFSSPQEAVRTRVTQAAMAIAELVNADNSDTPLIAKLTAGVKIRLADLSPDEQERAYSIAERLVNEPEPIVGEADKLSPEELRAQFKLVKPKEGDV